MPQALPPSRSRWVATALVAAVLPFGVTALASPASASGSPADGKGAPAPIAHPDADHMGSTIRAHEPAGTASGAAAAPSAGRSGLSQAATAAALPAGARPLGVDVASYEGTVDWTSAAAKGASFAYVKATEGTGYLNPSYSSQYNGSAAAGLYHGAYHFALPDRSSGKVQADYFVDHGGSWSADGKTLPPLLDIEYNPYGATCFGLSTSAMNAWIADFSNEVEARTGRAPSLYTTTDWWSTCTGNSAAAGGDPLFIANYNGSAGPLPAGWSGQHIWQYADSGVLPGDQDVFNGTAADLAAFAAGTGGVPAAPQSLAWPTVQQGATGYRVSVLQHLLNAHGAALTADGDFGSGTRSAVVSFQNSAGLGADGVVGPRTWQALVSTIGQGATGSTVKAAQTALNAHGTALTVDGDFGTGTRDAVVAYQVAQGLPADATVQKPTWLALLAS